MRVFPALALVMPEHDLRAFGRDVIAPVSEVADLTNMIIKLARAASSLLQTPTPKYIYPDPPPE